MVSRRGKLVDGMGFSVQNNGALGYLLFTPISTMEAPATRFTQSRHCSREAWCRIVSVGLASALGLWLGIGSLYAAWAEELSQRPQEREGGRPVDVDADIPDATGTGSASEQKPEGPRREPKFLPPILRPKQLTQEEYEEAERLRKLGAKYGTDPTAIVGRIQLSSQYADLPHGARLSDTVARVDIPFRGNWLLRVDTPFHRWLDSNRPGMSSAQGLGNLSTILGWRAYNTPEYAFFIGAASTFPTASQDTLGSGKYTVGPLIATGRFLPQWESFLFGVFQHSISAGGDPSRSDISLTQANVQINTIWAERWWSTVQGAWQVNWEQKVTSSMTFEVELGRNVVDRWGMYLRPGVGIWGNDVPYDWNVEVGTRYMFKSF